MDHPWAKHYTVVGPRTQRPRGTALASGTTPTWVAHGATLVPHRVLLLSALALGRDIATQEDQKEDAGHLEEGMRVEGLKGRLFPKGILTQAGPGLQSMLCSLQWQQPLSLSVSVGQAGAQACFSSLLVWEASGSARAELWLPESRLLGESDWWLACLSKLWFLLACPDWGQNCLWSTSCYRACPETLPGSGLPKATISMGLPP